MFDHLKYVHNSAVDSILIVALLRVERNPWRRNNERRIHDSYDSSWPRGAKVTN